MNPNEEARSHPADWPCYYCDYTEGEAVQCKVCVACDHIDGEKLYFFLKEKSDGNDAST